MPAKLTKTQNEQDGKDNEFKHDAVLATLVHVPENVKEETRREQKFQRASDFPSWIHTY